MAKRSGYVSSAAASWLGLPAGNGPSLLLLTPMIQNHVLVCEKNICGKQVANRLHDARSGEIPFGIVVTAHDQDTGMVTLHLNDEVVKISEVPVVAGENDARLTV